MSRILESHAILFSLLLCIIASFIFISPNGDEGVYIASAYQFAENNQPYIDYFWPQDIGFPLFMSYVGKVTGFSLLAFRVIFAFFSVMTILVANEIMKSYAKSIGLTITKIHLSIFLIVAIIIMPEWLNFAHIGTKTSITAFLLLLSILFLHQGVSSGIASRIVCAAITQAVMFSVKPSLIMIGATSVVYIYLHEAARNRFILYFVATGLLVSIIIHINILSSLDNFNSWLSDILYSPAEARMREQDLLGGIRNISSDVFVTTYLLIFFPLISVVGGRHKFKLDGFAVFLIITYIVIYLTNVIAFFPIMGNVYSSTYMPLLIIAFLILALRNMYLEDWDFKRLSFLVWIAISTAAYTFPSFNPYYLLPRNFVEQMLGKNEVRNELDELGEKMDTDYLYVGRHHFEVLGSRMKQSVYSVVGTNSMDIMKPDRETANTIKVIAETNFQDLCDIHQVIVLDHKYIDENPNIELKFFVDIMERENYKLVSSTYKLSLYVKEEGVPLG
jgi:hypothetical protein